jgi:hypothetical protein
MARRCCNSARAALRDRRGTSRASIGPVVYTFRKSLLSSNARDVTYRQRKCLGMLACDAFGVDLNRSESSQAGLSRLLYGHEHSAVRLALYPGEPESQHIELARISQASSRPSIQSSWTGSLLASSRLRLDLSRPQRSVGGVLERHRHNLSCPVDGDMTEKLQPIGGAT